MSYGTDRDFVDIEEAVEEIRAGRILVVVDDEDRENEGDLLMAADKVTPEAVNFMAKHGRGLICMPMMGERLDQLQISMMVSDNTAPLGTAFTVSVDARRGVTTGTSAFDRAVTIRTLVDPAARPDDLTRPGPHLPAARDARRRAAPRRPHRGGGGPRAAGRLLARRGHLRGARRGGRHGADARSPGARPHLRAQVHHHQGSDRVPHPEGEARAAGGDDPATDGLRRVHRDRLRDDGGRPAAAGARVRRRGRATRRCSCACTPSA